MKSLTAALLLIVLAATPAIAQTPEPIVLASAT